MMMLLVLILGIKKVLITVLLAVIMCIAGPLFRKVNIMLMFIL